VIGGTENEGGKNGVRTVCPDRQYGQAVRQD